MAVVVDATGSKLVGGSAVASINYSGITVGTALSNGALLATLVLGNTNTTSAWTATWDNGGTNQVMTVIASRANATVTAVLFGLLNPTAGNKTLAFAWTNTGAAQFPVACAQSYTGVDQTNIATAFANSTTGTASSLAVTSATNDMAIGLIGSGGLTSLNQTPIYNDTTSSGADSAASRAAGAASVTFTATGASGNIAMAGIDIVAAAAALGINFQPLVMM